GIQNIDKTRIQYFTLYQKKTIRSHERRFYVECNVHSTQLMEKYSFLLKSVDPDRNKEGFERINEDGRECSWHVNDESSQIVDEIAAVWNGMTEFARCANVGSYADEEDDDGGMDHKLYDQLVEYFKSGEIPYENYSSRGYAERCWLARCKEYSLSDDRKTLKKGTAIVLKNGEVKNVLTDFHRKSGHASIEKIRAMIPMKLCCVSIHVKYMDILAQCGCKGSMNSDHRGRCVVSLIYFDGLARQISTKFEGIQQSHIEEYEQSLDRHQFKATMFSLGEEEYAAELRKSRSGGSKYRIASDGRTLLTFSGAIVLKEKEAMDVCMRIHELCGHPNGVQMRKLLQRFVFVRRVQSLCETITKKCNFCRCKNKTGNVLSTSPIDCQHVKLEIKVNYDSDAAERRFEIIPHGVDSKIVDDYVKNSICTLKKHGKWKEPMISREAIFARSILRVVDLLRTNRNEKIENVQEYDPIQEQTSIDETIAECDGESETSSVVESCDDGELSGEEEEEKIEDEEGESDEEDEEVAEMRRELAEKEMQAEAMEKEASRLADASGRMRSFIRQWELSNYLREQIRLEENPGIKAEENQDCEDDERIEDEEEEQTGVEETHESDKENTAANEAVQGTFNEEQSKCDKKKRAKKRNKKKKRGDRPPFDLPPYRPNYEENEQAQPNTVNTVQMERVEEERKETRAVPPFVSLLRESQPARKRGRLAQLRREKEELERNTKKEDEKREAVPPFVSLLRESQPARKRGRLAQLRREKEELEINTKKEDEKRE
ncbi:hypothetical protein PFISCL1PPCAC_20206, partial [Pristionchus fissidentatus]